MVDPETGKPFVAAAAHRIGNEMSFPVDNCAMGGFTAAIDVETGIMGKAIRTKVKSRNLEWFSNHPDSGTQIEGFQIPNWANIRDKVLDIASNISFVPYIGWDIVLTPDGFTIIEGNDGPDLKLHQVHKPLLSDARIKRFYAYHGVI
jgi:hypothetical protein